MAGRLDGRHAFITGGESGIGLATAELFLAEGARVSILGQDRVKLDAARERLGDAARTFAGDVTNAGDVSSAVTAAVSAAGPLDAVFSNAGISGVNAPLEQYPADDFQRVLAVHVLGAFHVLQHALPVVRDGGSIVINSSVVGLTAAPGIAGYATAKHAQVGLMRVAAMEAAPRRIRVNTIHPGPTDTAFQRDIEVTATGLPPDQAAAAFEQRIPLRRHASVEDIARTVLFLCSDDSAFMTGATVAVDGGMSV
jgi:NAD(P)-dependent dehydrogenase (short-subunit alcohol dehydrogenase family)